MRLSTPPPTTHTTPSNFFESTLDCSLQGMSFFVFILAAATVGALSAPRTEVAPIESLRFNTRSPSGWLLLVTLIVLPLEVFLLIVRFLNFTWVIEHIKIALGIVSEAAMHVYVLLVVNDVYRLP